MDPLEQGYFSQMTGSVAKALGLRGTAAVAGAHQLREPLLNPK